MTLISFISSELIELELPEAEQSTIPEEPGERQYVSINAAGDLFLAFANYKRSADSSPKAA